MGPDGVVSQGRPAQSGRLPAPFHRQLNRLRPHFNLENIAPPFNTNTVKDCWYFDPDTGQPLVDFFIRFEDLQAGFDTVCDTLSLPRKPLLHMQNQGARPAYRDHYTPQTRDIVAKLFARDIEFFGYQY